MRDIKFKAWCSTTKIMYLCENLSEAQRLQDKGCTLLQFTGLNDWNGQALFEGDMALYTYRSEKYHGNLNVQAKLGKIAFYNGSFRFLWYSSGFVEGACLHHLEHDRYESCQDSKLFLLGHAFQPIETYLKQKEEIVQHLSR